MPSKSQYSQNQILMDSYGRSARRSNLALSDKESPEMRRASGTDEGG
jgi:hypothetical protein